MTGSPLAGRPPRVFVTYAYDSTDHVDQVLRFCELLRRNGVDAWLDKWDDVRPRNWGEWAEEQIDVADFVLVIASPAYQRAARGGPGADDHPGARAEAALLRDRLHEDPQKWSTKILAVVLPGRQVIEIPAFLHPFSRSHYIIPEVTKRGANDLLRVLTGQPRHRPPELGEMPVLTPELPVDAPVTSEGSARVAATLLLSPDEPRLREVTGTTRAQPGRAAVSQRHIAIAGVLAVLVLTTVVSLLAFKSRTSVLPRGNSPSQSTEEGPSGASTHVTIMRGGDRVNVVSGVAGVNLPDANLVLSARQDDSNQFVIGVVNDTRVARADTTPGSCSRGAWACW
jgi:SEFIR domain